MLRDDLLLFEIGFLQRNKNFFLFLKLDVNFSCVCVCDPFRTVDHFNVRKLELIFVSLLTFGLSNGIER